MSTENYVENHPGFGMVSAAHVSSSQPTPMFGSETKHTHYVVLRVSHAERQKLVSREAYYERDRVTEVRMTESQWARFVSSMNTSGTPCTLEFVTTNGEGRVEDIPFIPLLEQTVAKTRAAAEEAYASIMEAFDTYRGQKNAANLRALQSAITNAAPNVAYASEVLAEHAEEIGNKLQADIEAMVQVEAQRAGLDPSVITRTAIES